MNSSNNNSKLVWSDDPKDQKCSKCGEFKQNCKCQPEPIIKSNNWVAIFRLEKNGRGGKTVTVIDNIPKNELFLKELTKELKQKCGVGGTYLMDKKEGVIEIQGDKRDAIKAIFDKKGFKYKGM